jgi:hypothetical protein
MSLFDAYVMVDWSGGNSRRARKQDCIWIAYGPTNAGSPTTVSPPSRTEAEHIIHSLLQLVLETNNCRILLCADFGYGYPAGFTSLLQPVASGSPPWRIAWQYLAKHVKDDLGNQGRSKADQLQQPLRGRERDQCRSFESPLPRSVLGSLQVWRVCLCAAEKTAAAVRLCGPENCLAPHH